MAKLVKEGKLSPQTAAVFYRLTVRSYGRFRKVSF